MSSDLPVDAPPLSSSAVPDVLKTAQAEFKKELDEPVDSDLPIPEPIGQRPSVWLCALAGGIGGVVGDSSMHSLDTVKTRQQGAPHAAKYQDTVRAYFTIWKEEGFCRGLYSGYGAAMLGSLPSTATFFLTYETIKRTAIDNYGLNETVSYLGAGFLGDFASSIFYVPSEVVKTRLQLQGRHNNPYFHSGYNYTGTFNAFKTIVQQEGWQTLFFGYRATLFRDLPFSALQFTFYENFRNAAYSLSKTDKGKPLSTPLELLTGAAAGGLAGILTTPTDVVKTRTQTQNTSSGNPHMLKSDSLLKNLLSIYRNEGVVGLFGGVGPRFVWTSVQSSVMLLLYQVCLRALTEGESSQFTD